MQLKDSVATAVALMSTVASATLDVCPPNGKGVCYSIGVPKSSASSGSGTLYMQIRAPTTFSWVALGTGSGMANSNIFLMYQDGSGNVTVSPRQGTRYTPPQLDTSATAARLELLAGSGISADGSSMTANIACTNCQSWSGGSMSLADTQTKWVGAWSGGKSLATKDKNAGISIHDDTTVFTLDLSKAATQSEGNPFVGSGSEPGTGSNNNGGGAGGSADVTFGPTGPSKVLIAHGLVMALLFVVLFPLASMAMPLFGKWKLHGGVQGFNFILMWIGFGMGIVAAKQFDVLFKDTHTTLGTVVVCLLILQPFLGYAHHMHYVKHQSRGLVSYVHIFWGQSLMVLGVINGGLGLQAMAASSQLIVAYAVVTGVVFALYIAVKVFTIFRARRGVPGDKEASTPTADDAARRRPYP